MYKSASYGKNSFLYANRVKRYQFKGADSEIKPYLLLLGNISKDFTADNVEKQGLMNMCMIFLLIIILLISVTFGILINI